MFVLRMRARSSTDAVLSWLDLNSLAWILVLLAYLGGCSSSQPTYPVRGKVEFADGAAVTFGSVELRAANQAMNARGSIRPDGSFELTTFETGDGAIAGKHQVIVIQLLLNDRTTQHRHRPRDLVDRKYADYRTSGLVVDVEPTTENRCKLVVERLQR